MSVIKPGLDVQHAQSGLVFLIQLCLVNHSSRKERPNLFPMFICCVLSNLFARGPNLLDYILSCVIVLFVSENLIA